MHRKTAQLSQVIDFKPDKTRFFYYQRKQKNVHHISDIGILRLVKPLPIHVVGSIQVYDSQIQSTETNWHKTYLNLPQNFHNQVNDYSSVDIFTSYQLFDSFYKASYNPNSRLRLATDSFIRTSFTEPIMFAMNVSFLVLAANEAICYRKEP